MSELTNDFIQNYKIYSSDQVEDRYLLTPIFIDRFNRGSDDEMK